MKYKQEYDAFVSYVLHNKKIFINFFIGAVIVIACICLEHYAVNKQIRRIETIKAGQEAQHEAELREKGLMPQEPRRRPKKEIYIPNDLTGQQDRASSTDMLLKSAENQFGQKGDTTLSVIDYGTQVDEYQQRVDVIKQAETNRLAQQQAQQEAFNQRTGRTAPQPQRQPGVQAQRQPGVQPAKKEEGTKIKKLQTSTLGSSGSSRN